MIKNCCFCDKEIITNKTDPCAMHFLTNIYTKEKEQYHQIFYCHLQCFKKTLTSNVPLYLEDLVND